MKVPVPAGLLVWCVVVGGVSCAVAQDVTIRPLQWFHAGEAGDVLPVEKGFVAPEFPEDLEKTTQLGWAEIDTFLSARGAVYWRVVHGSLPYYEEALNVRLTTEKIAFEPARRGSKDIRALVRQTVVFNPASAAPGRPDATPRLLDASIVIDPTRKVPAEIAPPDPEVLWVQVSLDEQGRVTSIAGVPESSAKWLEPKLRGWRFAPARRGGKPVAAEVAVPVIVAAPGNFGRPGWTPAWPKSRQPPEYPLAERRARVTGMANVEFVVDADGYVRDASIVQMTTEGFGRAALDAIERWRFEPARLHGQPVVSRSTQEIDFNLEDENSSGGPGVTVTKQGNGEKLPEGLRYDTAPMVRRLVQPKYPYAQLRKRVGGSAEVLILIDAQGKVTGSRVVKADLPEFGGALQAAVERFKYRPALKHGDPTPTMVTVSETFEPDPAASLVVSAEEMRVLKVEQKHPEQLVKANELDRRPRLTYAQPPLYPRSITRPVAGQAMVEFLIGERGEVLLPRIVSSSAPAFGYAAVQAVAEWRFAPPTRQGKPVMTLVRVPVKFEPPPK